MSGDYQLEDTVYIPFTTRQFSDGVPTALVSGEVQIYEDASVTQITGAETLSVSLDSVAGFNMVQVDMTAANGFESGKSYTLILSAGTVGGTSVIGEVVGHFTIEMSAAALDLANGTDGLGAIKTDTAAILVDTGTTLDGKIDTIDSNVDAILLDTAEIGTAGAGLTNINLPNQTMDITGDITGNLSGSVGSVTGHTAQTGDSFAIVNGAAGLVAIDAVVDGIQTDLDNGTDGLGALKTLIDAAQTDLDTLTDARGEPAQGAPAVSTTMLEKIDYLYKAWRNKSTQTATTYSLFADDTTTVDHKATVSDDATTATKGEVATGP